MEGIYNLYVKPFDNSFEWVKIKSIMDGKIMTKYMIEQEKPLTIGKTRNIDKFHPNYGRNGSIQILCSSDIIITKNGILNANECGMDTNVSLFCKTHMNDIEKINGSLLKYGGAFTTESLSNGFG
eukprot:816651_1